MASNQLSYASRMIEDVVDLVGFPTIIMHAYYGTKHITSGCTIRPSIAREAPRITISGYPRDLYTLIRLYKVMTDPDAPNPSEPSLREWVHWIITDIPGGTNPSQGKEILPYMPPRPLAGIHRYILILCKLKGPLGLVEPPLSRANFCSRAFTCHMDLVAPVAIVYFNAQGEPKNRNC